MYEGLLFCLDIQTLQLGTPLFHPTEPFRPGRPTTAKGQTLPSGGRSTNDRSRTVSGSPSVESRASAERREQSSDEQPGLDGSFNDLIGASKQRLRHGET